MKYLLVIFILMSFSSYADRLTDDEIFEQVFARTHYVKPDNVQYAGEEVGLLKYCPNVTTNDYYNIKLKVINWLRLASTKYDKVGEMGFLNNRKLNKLMEIFNNGERIGQRDAKIMRYGRKYKYTLCPEILASSKMKGPKPNLMKLVPDS